MAHPLELASKAPKSERTISLAADLFSARGKLAIRLLSLSDDEATGTCLVSPPCDSFAYLVRNKIKVPAVVAWAEDDRFGLRFEQPLNDDRRRTEFRHGRRRGRAALSYAAGALRESSGPIICDGSAAIERADGADEFAAAAVREAHDCTAVTDRSSG